MSIAKMSIAKKVIKILEDEVLGVIFGAGKYTSEVSPILGKIVFAGGLGVSYEDKPRNVMGGEILRSEVFKIIVKGDDYVKLEDAHIEISDVLRREGYIQLSGLEHIEFSQKETDNSMQLAATFKSTKQD